MKPIKNIYIVRFPNNFTQVFSTLNAALKVMSKSEKEYEECSLTIKPLKAVYISK